LFEKLGLPSGKKTKTGFSTKADLLEALAPSHEIAARVLEYRELTKLKSTYADALPRMINPETGRIHTSLNQAVAATGRLSSSDPNLQNIPVRSEAGREIRKAFVAPSGQMLLSCDYSQIELRVFAHFTRDPEMMRAFAADEDIHAATATRLFGVDLDGVTADMRRRAKTVNFAVIYGQSDFGLANTLGIPVEEAHAFIKSYFELFPGVRAYTDSTIEEARSKGYVQTLLGRRRYLPDVRSGNFNIRQAAERAAVNMPIQGTAADIMKLAMIDVSTHLPSVWYNSTLLLQVHDELVFAVDGSEVETAAGEIIRLMEHAYPLEVRLKVDAKAGMNWTEMTRVQAG
jgi:DNA polymerase I